MKDTIDPGHKYILFTLDGELPNEIKTLQFVKRYDVFKPGKGKFPGNFSAYPGTTLQSVLRCLINRVDYLQNQIPCWNNTLIKFCLGLSVWLLEKRAAKRHYRAYWHGINYAVTSPMCPKCGHTDCNEHQK
jgi:hypothetical protein